MTRAWEKNPHPASPLEGEGFKAWETAVFDFYTEHAHLVLQTLRVSLAAAQAYCDQRADALLRMGLAVFDDEGAVIAELADMALESAL